jgi:hypothetical protein
MDNHYIITKYCLNSSNMNLSFEEITKDFKTIKPSLIPILDISLASMLGKYLYRYGILKKWNCSSNLLEEILLSIKSNYPILEKIINSNIEKIKFDTQEAKNNFEDPSSLKFEDRITDTILELYKENTINFDKFDQKCMMDLITFKYEILKLITDSKSIYKIKWNEINKNLEILEDILINNFEELEDEPMFQDTISMIEKINTAAEKEIKLLITYTLELINTGKEFCKNANSIEDVYIYEDMKKTIKKKFNKQIDEIYYKNVMLYNFSTEIRNALLEMFEVEKSMHRLALTFSEIETI